MWLVFFSRGSFSEKEGGIMIELDFVQIVKVLKESEKLVRATRKLLISVGVIFPHMSELECALRDRAKEVEAYVQMINDDVDRPLIS